MSSGHPFTVSADGASRPRVTVAVPDRPRVGVVVTGGGGGGGMPLRFGEGPPAGVGDERPYLDLLTGDVYEWTGESDG